MQKRLPYKNPLFREISFLQPHIALYNQGRIESKDLSNITTRIGHVNITNLAFEWAILPTIYNDVEKKELAELEIEEMWMKIFEYKNFGGEKMFSNLESLVKTVFSFPHSNAEAERIFSMVTDIKNKKRNRLSNDTVSAMCTVRSSFQAKGINCINFDVDSRHLELHNSQNLYPQPSTSQDT